MFKETLIYSEFPQHREAPLYSMKESHWKWRKRKNHIFCFSYSENSV